MAYEKIFFRKFLGFIKSDVFDDESFFGVYPLSSSYGGSLAYRFFGMDRLLGFS